MKYIGRRLALLVHLATASMSIADANSVDSCGTIEIDDPILGLRIDPQSLGLAAAPDRVLRKAGLLHGRYWVLARTCIDSGAVCYWVIGGVAPTPTDAAPAHHQNLEPDLGHVVRIAEDDVKDIGVPDLLAEPDRIVPSDVSDALYVNYFETLRIGYQGADAFRAELCSQSVDLASIGSQATAALRQVLAASEPLHDLCKRPITR